jgi:hypothetical protein
MILATTCELESIVTTYLFSLSDRHMWDAYDPMIISEGLFSFGNVLAFFRLTYFMRINELLGPMQISLGKITSVRYLFEYTEIIVALPLQKNPDLF